VSAAEFEVEVEAAVAVAVVAVFAVVAELVAAGPEDEVEIV